MAMLSWEAGQGAFGVPAGVRVKQGYPALLSSNQVSGTRRSYPLPPVSYQFCPGAGGGAWDKHPLMPTQPSPPRPPHLVGLRHLGRPLLHARSHSQTLRRQGRRGQRGVETTGSGHTDGRQDKERGGLTWLVGFYIPSNA